MVTIGIRELRQHASRYVRLVRSGQRVAVTDRGELAAYLVPPGESGTVLDQLAARGEYQPPAGDVRDLLTPPPPHAGRPLSEVLQEMRDEERW